MNAAKKHICFALFPRFCSTMHTAHNTNNDFVAKQTNRQTSNKFLIYLREGQAKVCGEVPVQDSEENNRQSQNKVEGTVHPGLVGRAARHRREETVQVK